MSILEFNPIKGIRKDGSNDDYTQIPVPSNYEWGLQDLSKEGAGRTEDNVMQKKRSGQLEKLTLSWKDVKTEDASLILCAFNPEYIEIEYLSPLEGGYITSTFYVGDRKSVLFNSKRGVWETISFAITGRRADEKNV